MEKASTNASLPEERAGLYGFFASLCLKPVTRELAAMLTDGRFLAQLDAPAGSEGSREMALFAKEAPLLGDLVNELTAESTRLFVLPADVFPHEAFYTDPKRRLGGGVTTAVARFYESAGAQIPRQCTEMPDHIGIELQFMEFLCRMEADLSRTGDTQKLYHCRHLQKQFLEEHLFRWAFDCCEKIARFAKIRFYKAVALLLAEFLAEEREGLSRPLDSAIEMEQAHAV
jgi:TorA maturation chaperone TorD